MRAPDTVGTASALLFVFFVFCFSVSPSSCRGADGAALRPKRGVVPGNAASRPKGTVGTRTRPAPFLALPVPSKKKIAI